jgi:hypothetical protein
MKRDHLSQHFVICLNNRGYEVSLEKRKVYSVLEDAHAATLGMIRVKDESGESYLYPEDRFALIKLPPIVLRAFSHAA